MNFVNWIRGISPDAIVEAIITIIGYAITYAVSIHVVKKQINDNTEKFKENSDMTQKIQLLELRSKNRSEVFSYMHNIYSSLLEFQDNKKHFEQVKDDVRIKKYLAYDFFIGIQGIENYMDNFTDVDNKPVKADIRLKVMEEYFSDMVNVKKLIIYLNNKQEEMNKFETLFINYDNSKNKILSKLYEVDDKLFDIENDFIVFNMGKNNEKLLDEIIKGIDKLYNYYMNMVKPENKNPVSYEIIKTIREIQNINN